METITLPLPVLNLEEIVEREIEAIAIEKIEYEERHKKETSEREETNALQSVVILNLLHKIEYCLLSIMACSRIKCMLIETLKKAKVQVFWGDNPKKIIPLFSHALSEPWVASIVIISDLNLIHPKIWITQEMWDRQNLQPIRLEPNDLYRAEVFKVELKRLIDPIELTRTIVRACYK